MLYDIVIAIEFKQKSIMLNTLLGMWWAHVVACRMLWMPRLNHDDFLQSYINRLRENYSEWHIVSFQLHNKTLSAFDTHFLDVMP